MNYILDTNLVLIYLRNNEISRQIEKDLQLLKGEHNVLISVVTIGELKSISKQNKWGKRKMEYLIETLKEFLIADINTEEIIEKYAEIDAYSQGKLEGKEVSFTARNMGKNDLWIAATSSIYNIDLITTDKDFRHLEGEYIKLREIQIEKYKS